MPCNRLNEKGHVEDYNFLEIKKIGKRLRNYEVLENCVYSSGFEKNVGESIILATS